MLKQTFILMLALGLSLNAGARGSFTSSPNNLTSKKTEITAQDITAFLVANGYTVLSTPVPRNGGQEWVCLTMIKGQYYLTTVFVEGEYITGWEDNDLG